MVIFNDDGRGSICNALMEGEGATDIYFLSSAEGAQTITLNYDRGGSDTLHLSDWSGNELTITAEGSSDWFVDGKLVRDD